MKTSNYVRKDYYNDLSRSRYSSQTSRRLKSAHNLDLNDTKTVTILLGRDSCVALIRFAQPTMV